MSSRWSEIVHFNLNHTFGVCRAVILTTLKEVLQTFPDTNCVDIMFDARSIFSEVMIN